MARKERVELIKELEEARESRVVCYVMSDRQGWSGRIAGDALPWIYDHLQCIGERDKVDLFLYTAGGLTMAAVRIAGLLREYADRRFGVIVPYKAHSAGTLIALAADEIVMLPLAQLSPVDPSTMSPFNPVPPTGGDPAQVPVEDVVGYLDLARKEAGLTGGEEIGGAFERLASEVHPLALGAVYRAREQIREVVRKLLGAHMAEEIQVDRIVQNVTEKLRSHDYPITRADAKEMLLPVVEADERVRAAAWGLYKDYESEMSLLSPYQPSLVLGDEDEATVSGDLAYVESILALDAFAQTRQVRRRQLPLPVGPNQPPVMQEVFQEAPVKQGWERRESASDA